MLLEQLSSEKETELKSLIVKYPNEYKKLVKELFKKGRYYPTHGFYGIAGYTYLANDTYIIGQHWFYDNLMDLEGANQIKDMFPNISK